MRMTTDAIGYAAACLVLATFSMRSMMALRLTALASNVAFIAYAISASLPPVGALHLLLLPLNAWHLMHLLVHDRKRRSEAGPS
jgi:hypothetical protein